MLTNFWAVNLKGRDHSEELGVDGMIILEWILGEKARLLWTRFVWLRIGTSGRVF
jgi:hypothetical protein